MSETYIPLHVHTHYSKLDGLSKPKEIMARCRDYGIPACAVTDHGVLFGAFDFYQTARAAGIKPIIGCELYVSPTTLEDKSAKSARAAAEHLVALCRDEEGWHNLCRLSSIAHLRGMHYKPRVDDETLDRHRAGLIFSSACLSGRISRRILEGDLDAADRAAARYAEMFGPENFLIELMNHGMEEQERVNAELVRIAARHGLLTVATNDSHYTDQADSEAHDVLLCLETHKTLDDADRMRLPNNEFYFRSPEEMRSRFARWPEALENTLAVAERCNLKIPEGLRLIPDYKVPGGGEKAAYLRQLVAEGLAARYGSPPPETHRKRADYECGVIEQMNFVDYFLVVWDLIRFAREKGIAVGPGRGSGAGSIVAYALRITNLDPVRYNLLFERFLNPERVSMPDFDIDFCFVRRPDMIDYAKRTYGEDNVSQIATFGRMLMKDVVRNVGRVLGMPLNDVDRLARMLPADPKANLDKAYEGDAEIRRVVDEDRQVGRLWGLAKRLEGTIKSIGTHAAGVVICDHALTDHVALYKDNSTETVSTQMDMSCVEKIGLLKMDFLGLRTLTMIHDAVDMVRRNRGITVDMDNLPLDDEKTYALLRSGQTMGIFQLESPGMRDLAKNIGLQSLEEMSALVALYRPGPMSLIPTYIANKFDPSKIQYEHPVLEPVLRETYGIPVYQEQVMQMTQACAGFTLGAADIVRRAMSKKKQEELDKQKEGFVRGCVANGITKQLAETLWAKIETFSGYGFNKSHSAAYALVAYQTAYLKANFPLEFMSALLTSETGNLEKTAVYIEECRRMGIEVLPPDINRSGQGFTVDGGSIRFGLGSVRNVGEKPCEEIVKERAKDGPFKNIYDFCKRLPTQVVNMRVLESLNKAGAFLGTGWNRRQVEAVLEKAVAESQLFQRDQRAGQTSLFDMGGVAEDLSDMYERPELPEWQDHQLWEAEKEVLGLYITSHPLWLHRDTIEHYATPPAVMARDPREGEERVLAGVITNVRRISTKKGDPMAFVTLETLRGSCELTAFSEIYRQKAHLMEADMVVIARAKANFRNERLSYLVEDIMLIDDAERSLTRALHVRLEIAHQDPATLRRVAEALAAHPGPCDVYLHCRVANDDEVVVHAPESCRVAGVRALRPLLETLLGEGAAFFSGGMGLPSHRRPDPAPDVPRWKQRQGAARN
ncbi:MAG TPA: DNA polymerase III subunit alpha [Candidatus Hydrogenedentes bacterium]|nr:DNA polymerase III subunit alpha [Candidatus Hydrogenedentota bacterium]